MRNLYVLVLIFWGLSSCDQRNPGNLIQQGRIVIAGKIQLSDNYSKSITINYSGGAERHKTRTLLIDSSGIFQFELNILHPQDILLNYDKGYAVLFGRPSDSLYLEFNSADFKKCMFPNYMVCGTNFNTSKDILAYKQYNQIDEFIPDVGDKTVEEYLVDIKHYIHLNDSVLTEFINIYKPGIQFIEWARKDIIYSSANYLIDYKIHHHMNGTEYEGDLFNKDIFPVNDNEAIISSMYGAHLWHYSTDNYLYGDSIIANLIGNDKLAEAYELCLLNIQNNEEQGLSRDIMSYWILSKLFDESFQDFSMIWAKERTFINDHRLAKILQERTDLHETQKNYNISVMDPESKEEKEVIGDFFTALEEKHKGKVMYIDIWATWCGPCRAEIPHAIELHNYFHNKPVVFVNLCMDSEKTEWIKALENLQIQGDNYYFDRNQSGLLRSKLGWLGYPTYMIVDKNGMIIDTDAPRPSSGIFVKELIEKIIDE